MSKQHSLITSSSLFVGRYSQRSRTNRNPSYHLVHLFHFINHKGVDTENQKLGAEPGLEAGLQASNPIVLVVAHEDSSTGCRPRVKMSSRGSWH